MADSRADASSGLATDNQTLHSSAAPKSRVSQLHPHTHRLSSSPGPKPANSPRRPSSVLSFSSIEDATFSFTDDVINVRSRPSLHDKHDHEHELTHWHSSPLAFAILPAVGGLLFKNGSAFVTDILLLGLAAIFMNWSIRLPWDWYYTAQAQQRASDPQSADAFITSDADEHALETPSSVAGSPRPSFGSEGDDLQSTADNIREQLQVRESAAAKLRLQELLALASTFILPACAAYLLHMIRAQLSGPSTNLVSDYNLSIFLLAAEVQPCRQLARLCAQRTLYLQRIASPQDESRREAKEEKFDVRALHDRIALLESRVSEGRSAAADPQIANKADVNDLSAEVKKRYEPRLEGLERAVRRYEKRSTTFAIMMDQRLQSLELRTQEALSLAAIAAQHSQNRSGPGSKLVNTAVFTLVWPLKTALRICLWPLNILDELYTRLKLRVLGPTPSRSNKKRASARPTTHGKDEKPKDKLSSRKNYS